MKKVDLRYYNARNFGDDLFVVLMLKRYRDIFTLDVKSRYLTFRKFKNVDSKLDIAEISKRIIRYVKRLTGVTVDPMDVCGDILVYAGGSIFMEGSNVSKWEIEKKFYESLDKPYYILGSNIGPYHSDYFMEIVKFILSNATDVCLREKYSYNLVKDIPTVRLATDMIFALNTSPYIASKPTENYVISVIDADKKAINGSGDLYFDTLAKIVTSILNDKKSSITLMSFCKKEGDEKACAKLMSMISQDMRDRVFIHKYRGDIDKSLKLIAESAGVVGSRFHANILGLVFGKKVLPIAYSDKTINILNDIGFKGEIVDIRKIDEFNADGFDFDKIPYTNISDQVKLAEKQFQELDKVLTRK